MQKACREWPVAFSGALREPHCWKQRYLQCTKNCPRLRSKFSSEVQVPSRLLTAERELFFGPRIWMVMLPCVLSVTPPNLLSPINLPFAMLLRSQMKILNHIDCSIDSRGYPIMTGMYLDFMLLVTALWAEQFIQFSALHAISLSSLRLISLWGCSWRRCQKPYWSQNSQCPVLPCQPRSHSLYCIRLSVVSGMICCS